MDKTEKDKSKASWKNNNLLLYVWGSLLSFLMIMTILLYVVVLPGIHQQAGVKDTAMLGAGIKSTLYDQNPVATPGGNQAASKENVEKSTEIDSTLKEEKEFEDRVVYLDKENEKQKIQLDSIWNEMVKLSKIIQPSDLNAEDDKVLDIAEIAKNIVELKKELEQVKKQILQRDAEIWTLKQIYKSTK